MQEKGEPCNEIYEQKTDYHRYIMTDNSKKGFYAVVLRSYLVRLDWQSIGPNMKGIPLAI